MVSDVYLAVETFSCLEDSLDLDNFNEIIRTDGPKEYPANPDFGECAWAKNHHQCCHPQAYSDSVRGEHCEPVSLELNNVKIIALYRSCKCPDSLAVCFKTHSQDEQEQMTNEVVIEVKELKVWTPEEKSWWRQKPTKQKTVILNNVTGCIRRNEFAAVIGPSGAGKTTFLVSLAGKCTLPSSGQVTLQGRNVKECPGSVEIVPQHEAFMNSLSVMEHLVFMTEMKLGSINNPRHQATLNSLLQELKLKPHKHTAIGALSGGERRLLSLATSLLSDPQILICDEPTTGLDSYNALLVIGVLKKLSVDGRVIICSVHQPSCVLFKEFSSILLMADGRLLFHGSQDDCQQVFESIELHCPMNYNPAEFYIRAVSNSSPNIDKLAAVAQNQWREYGGTMLGQEHGMTGTEASGPQPTEQSANREWTIGPRRNWFKQVHLLLWRLSLTLKRDIWDQFIQLLITVVVTAMVLGVAYAGVSGTTQRGIQDVRGMLWLITSEVAFGVSYSALYTFEYELPLFKREVGMYQCSAYFVSRFLSFIPRCIVWPITLVTMTTLAVDLPNQIMTTFKFILALMISAVPAVAYGLGMAALFTSTGIMADVMPCADLPLFLMSGAFIRISSLPSWMYPVKYISHFYYAMDAISNVYWRQIDHIDCPLNMTSCAKDGVAVLIGNGYVVDFILQDLLGFTFVTLFWALLGYYGLKREERKGYAY